MMLAANKNIEQICIVGIGMPQPLGIVVLSDVGMQKPKNEIVESFSSLLEEVNLKLDDYEKVNNFPSSRIY